MIMPSLSTAFKYLIHERIYKIIFNNFLIKFIILEYIKIGKLYLDIQLAANLSFNRINNETPITL